MPKRIFKRSDGLIKQKKQVKTDALKHQQEKKTKKAKKLID